MANRICPNISILTINTSSAAFTECDVPRPVYYSCSYGLSCSSDYYSKAADPLPASPLPV